jgi:hypothetical protein
MIENTKIKIHQIIQSHIPEFFETENPRFVEFLKQYYISQEFQGGPIDLVSNFDVYKNIDSYSTNVLNSETKLSQNISETDSTIYVLSTSGWPSNYGLLKIDDEIITYTGITTNTFTGCVRGFSGIDSLKTTLDPEKVSFSVSKAESHSTNLTEPKTVNNLSVLFINEFFTKFKKQFAHGLENRKFYEDINQINFLKQAKDFYRTKGTDESIKILFRILYGKEVEIIKPQEYLIKPSDSDYEIVEQLVCRRLIGDPIKLKGYTLFQDKNESISDIGKATGSITDVEVVRYNTNLSGIDIVTSSTSSDGDNAPYYIISLSSGYNRDSFTIGTIDGKFSISPKTYLVDDISESSNVITVDSTVSFPSFGKVILEDSQGYVEVSYSSKNINQFIDCSQLSRSFNRGSILRSTSIVYGYEENDITKKVELIVTGVINDFEIGTISSLYGSVKSNILDITGNISGSGFILGSDSLSGNGIISGTNTELDGISISGKITGSISGEKINGIINETNNSILDGSIFNGYFIKQQGFANNILTGDTVRIKSLGKIASSLDPFFYSWIYNTSTRSRVLVIDSAVSDTVKLTTYDDHQLKLNDAVELISILTNNVFAVGIVNFINNKKTVSISMPSSGISNSLTWDIRRKILYGKTNNLDHNQSNLTRLISNIQNTYDYANNTVIVASESIPSYTIEIGKNIKEFSLSDISDNKIYIPNHDFFSGDSIYYQPKTGITPISNLVQGTYYIIRIDINNIRLTRTRTGILNNSFIIIPNGTVTKKDHQLIPSECANKEIKGQKLLKQFTKTTQISDQIQTTPTGGIGMFVNGVELLNYKSPQKIYYGKIESIDILESGNDYDVIFPPNITIASSNGTGALAYPSITGSVKGASIENTGFDFLEEPKITVKGGNGVGAVLKARLSPIIHKIEFDSSTTGYVSAGSTISIINTIDNTFRIENMHKFREADKVVYGTNGNRPILISSGISTELVNNSLYYVSIVSDKKFKLHLNEDDALNKTNEIDIVGFGTGLHYFQSTTPKKIISNIIVESEGSNYRRKKRQVSSAGINTSDNIITIENHDYQDGDYITYTYLPGSTPISGLSTDQYYQVTIYDSNNFRLSSTGIGITLSSENFNKQKFLKFSDSGSGDHIFDYPPIEIFIDSKTGIGSSFGGNAILSPIVRGKISSISVFSGGVGYGSSDSIVNYDSAYESPKINVESGSGAILEPIINNGSIKFVIVKEGGSNYTSIPNIIIDDANGTGVGAILSVNLNSNKSISSVTVVFEGIGYSQNTALIVNAIGSGCILRSKIQSWTLNLFTKNLNKFTSDDGILVESNDPELGIKYASLYPPINLRKSLISNNGMGSGPDLEQSVSGVEIDRSSGTEHSPIIGWAYDGNPIYGPYGYKNGINGGIKLLKSGYKLVINSIIGRGLNGPPTSIFLPGYFVEDYEYQGIGDLDVHNGKFCVTPEFLNGTYAYFTTLSSFEIKDSSSRFYNYKIPEFPYVIGDNYRSAYITSNFNQKINQRDIDLNSLNIVRNTYPYKFEEENSVYEYCIQPHKKVDIESNVIQTASEKIDSINIIDSGNNYKVGDQLVVDISDTGSNIPIISNVKSVLGVGISHISLEEKNIDFVEISLKKDGIVVGTTTEPHDLKNEDMIQIYNVDDRLKELEGLSKIGITSFSSQLSSAIGSTSITGISTFIYINSALIKSPLEVNDIIQISNEQLKIIGINYKNNSLNVIRKYGVSSGSSHTIGTLVSLNSRKIIFFKKNISSIFGSVENKQYYFNPKETVGLGTVGISTFVSYIGITTTEFFTREVKLQSIYIENHGLKTGEKIIYSSGESTPLGVSLDTNVSFNLSDNQILYAVNLGADFVGLSTNSIGIGSTGSFVGSSNLPTPQLLYFTSKGSGLFHSIKTNRPLPQCKIQKYVGIVTTSQNHSLLNGDIITLTLDSNVKEKFYEVKYNSKIKKSIFNPQNFTSSGINTNTDTITLLDHGFVSGDKILYQSLNSANPLINNTIYYIHKLTENTFKLTDCEYDSKFIYPAPAIDLITTGTNHTISAVNPYIKVYAYNSVGFGVSDSSLRDLKLSFFTDSNFINEFGSTETTNKVEIERIGIPGIDQNAQVILKLNNQFPNNIFYQLNPSNIENIKINNENDKLDILPDKSSPPLNSNKIDLIYSQYNGDYIISKENAHTFKINLISKPEKNYYDLADLNYGNYTTKSQNYSGPISSFEPIIKSSNFKKSPKFLKVNSDQGSGANIFLNGSNVGIIKKVNLNSIGFEFPSDKTLKPIADIPTILEISDFYTLSEIKVLNGGRDYQSKPNLKIYNTKTGLVEDTIITNISLSGQSVSNVDIVSGGRGLSNYNLIPITLDNSNGLDILSYSFNSSTKIATVTLQTPPLGFTTATYPFIVGEKVFIEGTSIIDNTGSGYNSSDYAYQLFTVVGVNTAFGSANAATVSYNISGISSAGIFKQSYGKIIKSEYLPSYELFFKEGKNIDTFSKGEVVSFGKNRKASATVIENQGWDKNTFKLRVNKISGSEILIGDLISGNSSGNMGIIRNITVPEGLFKVDSISRKQIGSSKDTGKLSYFSQRLHDNNYYQRFSYSIKGTENLNNWDEKVSSLVHTAGFKKFSDLLIESSPVSTTPAVGISTIISIVNLNREISVERIHDFDLVREDKIGLCSRNVSFNGKIITDFFRSDKNRVITIDDFSGEFRNNPDLSTYTVIDSFFGNTLRTCKYVVQFYDPDAEEYEFAQFMVVHNNFEIFINDYTGTYNNNVFGSFSAQIDLGFIEIRFTPYDQDINLYIKVYRVAIRDDLSTGVTNELGFTHRIGHTTSFTALPGVSQTLVSIASSQYQSINFIAQVSTATSNYILPIGSKDYHSIEGFALYDNSGNDYAQFYGEINSYRDLGIFDTSYSSGNLNINFTLNSGISTTTFNGSLYIVGISQATGIGTTSIFVGSANTEGTTRLRSSLKNIPSSGSPGITTIVSIDKNVYRGSKYFIQVGSNNGNTEIRTILGFHDDNGNTYHIDYGNTTNCTNYCGLGTFDFIVRGNNLNLEFTPIIGTATTVKVFSEEFKKISGAGNSIFSNIDIFVDDFNYVERLQRYRYSFNLKHIDDSVFSKRISYSGINTISSNIIFTKSDGSADDHFFVTGEEVTYDYVGISTQRITVQTGTGYTNKLPNSIFVIKSSENSIQLSTSRSDAIAGIALTIIDAYQYSSDQTFDALDSNKKCVIQIDSIIQQPMTWTSVNYTLNTNISGLTTTFNISGITSITNTDIIKINNEFMYIESCNYPNLNDLIVRRSWLGTNLDKDISHNIGDSVRLYKGDYNIVKDIIYFKDAPFGSNVIGKDFLSKSLLKSNSSFQGRFFQKSDYQNNIIFDDISEQFTGIARTFTLTEEGTNIVGFALSESANSIILLRNIFQKPSIDYNIGNTIGIGTQISFTGRQNSSNSDIVVPYDVNANDTPRGGIIISIASTQGFGYQRQIRASGIATVSTSGSVTSVNIGTSYYTVGAGYSNYTYPGSGYIQSTVPITFDDPENNGSNAAGFGVVNSGIVTSIIITNGGIGYTNTNPPKVTFESPLPYDNISLTGSYTGIGASVSIIVGQGSSVIDFQITNFGYGYKVGDILTPVGILTDLNSSNFNPFTIVVDKVWYDKFSGWNVGTLELIVDISSEFDNFRKVFSLQRQGDLGIESLSIEKGSYGAIDLAANLIILLDGIIQRPGIDYIYNGGTEIQFTSAPKSDYKCQIFFFKGNTGDTTFVDIDSPIEIGDQLQIFSKRDNLNLEREDPRIIVGINSSNSVRTSTYCGPGISDDESYLRPVHLIKQSKDIVKGGEYISHKRLSLEPEIRPESLLIQSVNSFDSDLYVDAISVNFNVDSRSTNDVEIISQDNISVGNSFVNREIITGVSVFGGHGTIIGIGTSSIGIGTNTPMIKFTLNSINSLNSGSAGIITGIYFIVYDSNIGNGVTSINVSNYSSIVGIGTSFIDNVYKVDGIQISNSGIVTVFSNIQSLNGITTQTSGNGYYYGSYSWGKISGTRSSSPYVFNTYNNNGISGLSTCPIITRVLPFKIDL